MFSLKFKNAIFLALLSFSSRSVFSKKGPGGLAKPMNLRSEPRRVPAKNYRDSSFIPSAEISHDVSSDILTSSYDNGGLRGGDVSGQVVRATRLKVGGYFAIWYVLNIVYNSEYQHFRSTFFLIRFSTIVITLLVQVLNKKYLNEIPAPLTVGSLQFLVGSLYCIFLWVTRIRPSPFLTSMGKGKVNKVGFYHMMGQELSMISLGAGPVSFTHIVKALEPFFSAVVSAVIFGKWMNSMVYATLLPVVGGVAYACLKERSFSWLAFSTAMGSNLAFALRAVMSKSALDSAGDELGENLTPANLFGVVTIYAFVQSVPLFLLGEGLSFLDLWKQALTGSSSFDLVRGLIVSGLFHYLNNEVMYLALSNVHPVTLAVGNTMKRVFIVVASVIVFRNPITVQAAVGSAIGIGGVLLYSLTKQYYEDLEKQDLEREVVVPSTQKRSGRK